MSTGISAEGQLVVVVFLLETGSRHNFILNTFFLLPSRKASHLMCSCLRCVYLLSGLFSQEAAPPTNHSAFSGRHLPFVGFTFSKDCALSDVAVLKNFSEAESAADEVDSLTARAYEKRILKLEQENKETSRKLKGELTHLRSSSHSFFLGLLSVTITLNLSL